MIWGPFGAFLSNPLGEGCPGQGLAYPITADIRNLSKTLKQAQRLQNGGVNTDANAGISSFYPL
jgi:hypothetical protein